MSALKSIQMNNSANSMNYDIVEYEKKIIVGISANVDSSDAGFKNIELLWQEFFQQKIHQKLGLEMNADLCEARFDYRSDAHRPHTVVLGALLDSSAVVPKGELLVRPIANGRYAKFRASGPTRVREVWKHIWERTDLNRSNTCDFELIDSHGADVYVSLK